MVGLRVIIRPDREALWRVGVFVLLRLCGPPVLHSHSLVLLRKKKGHVSRVDLGRQARVTWLDIGVAIYLSHYLWPSTGALLLGWVLGTQRVVATSPHHSHQPMDHMCGYPYPPHPHVNAPTGLACPFFLRMTGFGPDMARPYGHAADSTTAAMPEWCPFAAQLGFTGSCVCV